MTDIRNKDAKQREIAEARELQQIIQDRDKERMKQIDSAFMFPRPQRWVKIVEIFMRETPGLREAMRDNALLARQQREEAGIWNEKIRTKDNPDMRLGMVMPPAVLNILETCDPEFKEVMASSENPKAQKKMFRMLTKAFPQFVVPQDLKS